MLGLLLINGLFGTALAARSDELRLELDPSQTEIAFELDATLHTVHGTARLIEGFVVFNSQGGPTSGRIVVAAASLSTANKRRDRKMHRAVLESESYPEIEFHPDALHGAVKLDGRSRLRIDGRLSVHGSEHPLTVEAEIDVTADELAATLEFQVPYVAWGMNDPSKLFLRVSDVVRVHIRGSGRLSPARSTVGPGAGARQ